MELKVILKIDDQVEIRDVEITEEDHLTYGIKCPGIYCTFVRKDSLYKDMNGMMFGFEKKELIQAWNEKVKQQIEFAEASLLNLKKCIVPEDLQENKYNINKRNV